MLFRPMNRQLLQMRIDRFTGGLFNDIEHFSFAVLLPAFIHATETDVAQVFQPFEGKRRHRLR